MSLLNAICDKYLYIEIFKYCNYLDYTKLSLVCKYFKELVNTDNYKEFIKIVRENKDEDLCYKLILKNGNLEHFKFIRFWKGYDNTEENFIINRDIYNNSELFKWFWLNCNYIKSKERINYALCRFCEFNNLEAIKWLIEREKICMKSTYTSIYSVPRYNVSISGFLIMQCANNNNIVIADWLNKSYDIDDYLLKAFYRSIDEGNYNFAVWIVELGKIDFNTRQNAFIKSCKNFTKINIDKPNDKPDLNPLQVRQGIVKRNKVKESWDSFFRIAEYLYSIDKYYLDKNTIIQVFKSLSGCYLDGLKWFFSIYEHQLNVDNLDQDTIHNIFNSLCYCNIDNIKWFYSIYNQKINIHHNNNVFFKSSCYYGNKDLSVAKWLYSLKDTLGDFNVFLLPEGRYSDDESEYEKIYGNWRSYTSRQTGIWLHSINKIHPNAYKEIMGLNIL